LALARGHRPGGGRRSAGSGGAGRRRLHGRLQMVRAESGLGRYRGGSRPGCWSSSPVSRMPVSEIVGADVREASCRPLRGTEGGRIRAFCQCTSGRGDAMRRCAEDYTSSMSSFELKNLTALVTGASSGIGAATAELFAELGAKVALGYHRNRDGAQATVDRVRQAGGTAVAFQADVRKRDDVERLVAQTVEALGPIDVLVNNAGSLVARQSLAEIDEATGDDVYALKIGRASCRD